MLLAVSLHLPLAPVLPKKCTPASIRLVDLFRSLSNPSTPQLLRVQDDYFACDSACLAPSVRCNHGLHAALDLYTGSLVRIGSPGVPIEQVPAAELSRVDSAYRDAGMRAVWLPAAVYASAYAGFCRRVLWPAMHSSVPDYRRHEAHDAGAYAAYVDLNKALCDAVAARYSDGDVIFINDYHLMLLPRLLRQRLPLASIAYFHHVAFPSSEVFRCLYFRAELLDGLLASDMVGFQTYSSSRCFAQSCSRLLGVAATPVGIELDDRNVALGIFPMGVDPDKIAREIASPSSAAAFDELAERYRGMQLVVGSDRLEREKGLLHKLRAFEQFLSEHPAAAERVALVQIAIASEQSAELLAVLEVVSRINATHGTLTHQPATLLLHALKRDKYLALLRRADAFVVTSLRDDMSLSCHEFVCSQQLAESKGALVLSEFCGSYGSLSAAYRVNPHDRQQTAVAIARALDAGAAEREQRWQQLRRSVASNTAADWISSVVGEAGRCGAAASVGWQPVLADHSWWDAAATRLLVVSLDGVLAPYVRDFAALPAHRARIADLVASLAAKRSTVVCVLSGRPRGYLDTLFPHAAVVLGAEHGCFMRVDGEWQQLTRDSCEWRQAVIADLQYYTERTPGSEIETKDCSVAWHFSSSSSYAQWQARELANHLEETLSGFTAHAAALGRDTVDVVPSDAKSAVLVRLIIERTAADAVVAIGASQWDNPVYDAVRDSRDARSCRAVTCSVGAHRTKADCRLASVAACLRWLEHRT